MKFLDRIRPVIKDDKYYCSKCSSLLNGEESFCGKCGAAIEWKWEFRPENQTPVAPVKDENGNWNCGNCGKKLDSGVKHHYCTSCGEPIDWETVKI